MVHSIQDRLYRAEQDFLQAVSQGLPALEAFQDAWFILSQDVQHASRTHTIDDDTSALWDSVASRIAILSDYLVDVETSAQTMTSTFHGELEAIFARVDINDLGNPIPLPDSHPLEESTNQTSSQSLSHSTSAHTPTITTTDKPILPYIDHAYSWLLKNLHNPYPSKETRDLICSQTGSSRTAIDAWFIDTRKRIGWNSLRRKFFSNKRIEIVEAATRFFVGPTRQREPYSSINLDSEFASLETRAINLYSEKLSESALASKLDIAVKDMTPEIKLQAKAIENQRRREERKVRLRAEKDAQAASTYPSPHRSPSLSPEPLLLSEDSDLSTPLPIPLKNRKRTSPFRDSLEYSSERPTSRSSKRSRLNVASDIDAAINSLPSPALSSNEPLPPTDDGIFVYPPTRSTDSTPAALVANRKRRLSDADSQGAPKRPRNMLSGHRLHAVSNPLPSPSTLFTWFENHFGIPSTMAVVEPDISPFDVEFYDYSKITSAAHSPSGDTESLSHPCVESGLTSFQTSHPASSSPLNISMNDFEYNVFAESEDVTAERFPQNDQSHGVSFPPFNPSVFEFDFTKTSFDSALPISDTAIIADPSTTILQNFESNFDWMFPPLLPSQNIYDPFQDLDSPQGKAVEFESLKMYFQPPDFSRNVVSDMSAEADKAAKQRKLIEMREATRRLEAEIAAS